MPREYFYFPLPDGASQRVLVRRHPRARYARISVQRDASLLLTLPTNRPLDEKRLIETFSEWVNKIWAKGELTYHHPAFPTIINIPLLDRCFTVTKDSSLSCADLVDKKDYIIYKVDIYNIIVLRKGNKIFVSDYNIFDEYKILALQKYLHAMAHRHIVKNIIDIANENNFPTIEIKIGNQRSKWGSCSIWKAPIKYVIHLNWRALLLPVDLLHHLYFHELLHIRYQNHSKAFYDTLENYSQNTKAKERQLGDVWKAMPAWVKYHEKYLTGLTDFALSSV